MELYCISKLKVLLPASVMGMYVFFIVTVELLVSTEKDIYLWVNSCKQENLL